MKIISREVPKLVESDALADSFYSIKPDHPDGIALSRRLLQGRTFQRAALTQILVDYNRSIDNDEQACANASRLLEVNSDCVLTGQQLGLLGGPLYTILKALSALLLAREAGSIPIFWLATEDHDIEEIAQTFIVESTGNLVRYHLSFPQKRWMVEDLILSAQHMEVISAFFTALNPCARPDFAFQPKSSNYALEMARFLAQIFRGTGLVFVEPRVLRSLSIPFFQKELADAEHLAQLFDATTKRLASAGVPPVLLRAHRTQLFLKAEDGQRQPISSSIDPSLLQNHPERFSCNAISRPVWQNWLFPVLAYVAGPTEVAYHRQLVDYHRAHGIAMPWIVPRLSASFVTAEAHRFCEKLALNPWDSIPESWAAILPDRSAPLAALGNEWRQAAQQQLAGLVPGAQMIEEIGQTIHRFSYRIQQADLAALNLPSYTLQYLKNLFQPRGLPQERLLNWNFFQAQCEENLIQALLKQLDWRHTGRFYINLAVQL